jgi:hypothetical protein
VVTGLTGGIGIFSLIVVAPLLQAMTGMSAVYGQRGLKPPKKRLRSLYLSSLVSSVAIFTYVIFVQLLLNMWAMSYTAAYLVVIWSVLANLNLWILPLMILLALLPPYPPRSWLSPLNRLCAIGTAVGAVYLTHGLLPLE